ncbi:bifunctional nuclease family protein [Methanoregula sp.]|uniref:bifunctional nuclease family protein n=1 Tax=Methanoregula sp. TaxID=2052170 RepID=UPI003BAEF232
MLQIKCAVKGVFIAVNEASAIPAVVLTDDQGRMLPIFVGLWEAISINSAQNNEVPPRPLTHDLFLELMAQYSITVCSMSIDSIDEGIYYAHLVLSSSGHEDCLDCRPSDGIAIALRANAPIFAGEDILASGTTNVNVSEMVALSTFLRS